MRPALPPAHVWPDRQLQLLYVPNESIFVRGPCNSWATEHGLEDRPTCSWRITRRPPAAPAATCGSTECQRSDRCAIQHAPRMYFDNHGSWSNWSLCKPETHASAPREFYNNRFISPGWVCIYCGARPRLQQHRRKRAAGAGNIFLDILCALRGGTLLPRARVPVRRITLSSTR